ncbi:hypothetical protein JCM21900_004192 [Sporobolomyces salmonicolor]
MSWLDKLAHHPLFTLPPDSTLSHPLSTHPSLSELARPASPELSAIFPASSTPRKHGAAISQSASSKSLFGLSSPGGRVDRSRLGGSQRSVPARQEREIEAKGARKRRMVVVRGAELVVAVGSELRIASLADVKARCQENGQDLDEEVQLGEYKVLNTPTVTFEIQQLVLNPTSKLLAVIGAHSVVVVVLPRKGWATSVGRMLECRSLPVGKFYHGLPGSPPVAQALWHPWGEHSSSLLILTTDSLLREYTISDDVEEPSQTLSFVRSSNGRGGFSAEDRGARRAVGLCVGEGRGDWGPLTLYAVMRNGDVVSLCPFLPKKALVPPSYIHALSCFVSTKVDVLAIDAANSSALTRFDPTASTSSVLTTPSKALALSRTPLAVTVGADIADSPRRAAHEPLSKHYNLQLQYVNSLVHQVASSSRTPPAADRDELMALEPTDEDAADRPVRVVAPSRPGKPALQGPFLMQPEPAELDNGAECRACDIAYVNYVAGRKEEGKEGEVAGAGLGVIAIAYSDGKVDLCLEVEKVEARWEGEEPLTGDEGEELPGLAVYETIDLGLASEINPSGDPSGEDDVARLLDARNCPTIVKDPLYADTLYVYHSLGAHCLLLSRWLQDLADAAGADEDDEKLQGEVEKTLKGQTTTEVLWVLKTLSAEDEDDSSPPPVVGLELINDVYLGYSLLLITASLQLVGIELSLRVDPSLRLNAPPSTSATPSPQAHGISPDPPAYVSLLDTPFSIPSALAKRAGGVSTLPRLASNSSSSSKELIITPDVLRQLGKAVEQVQTSIRDVVAGADAVQHRLELQMKELSRQLGKLDELSRLSGELRSSTTSREGLAGRLARVEDTQRALLARTDRVLQRLMDAHQPSLSTYEKKWFDELRRLEREVKGTEDGAAGRTLEERARRVEAQTEALWPALEEMRRKKEGKGEGKERPGELGSGQLQKLEGKLADEAKLIADARKKVERLAHSLAGTSLV